MNKLGLHAHTRGQSRLNLSRESIDALQRTADRMFYSGGHNKLKGEKYYSVIRDPRANLLGYAVYRRVGDEKRKPRLVLASILNKNMKPKGSNISNFFNTVIKDNNTKLNVPATFPGMPPIPGS
jgi:hypothetical protein